MTQLLLLERLPELWWPKVSSGFVQVVQALLRVIRRVVLQKVPGVGVTGRDTLTIKSERKGEIGNSSQSYLPK